MTVVSGASYPPAGRARWSVAVLALVGFFVATELTLTSLLIEPMKQALDLSDVDIGLLQGTAFGLTYGVGAIPLGRLIDRAKRVRIIVVGLVTWMAAMVGTGFADNMAMLVICRAALGLVAAMMIPAVVSILADLAPPERRSVTTSFFAVGQACGQAFGILAGGLAFDALTRMTTADPGALGGLMPWRVLYIAAGCLGLVLLLGLTSLREPARHEYREDACSPLQAARELWAYRAFLLPLLAAMLFSGVAAQAVVVWQTPVLIRSYHLSPGQFAGWLSAVTLAGSILGSLAGGQFGEFGRRRAGPSGVLLPAVIAAAASIPLAFFGLAPNVAMFAFMLGAIQLFGAMTQVLGVIAISLNVPNHIRGVALGCNLFVAAVFGVAIGPLAIALVSGGLGGDAMLGAALAWLVAPCSLGAAICFGLAVRADRNPIGAETAAALSVVAACAKQEVDAGPPGQYHRGRL